MNTIGKLKVVYNPLTKMTVESPVVEACIKAEETRYLVGQEGGIHQCVHPNCGAIFGGVGLEVAEGRIYCIDVIQKLEKARIKLGTIMEGYIYTFGEDGFSWYSLKEGWKKENMGRRLPF